MSSRIFDTQLNQGDPSAEALALELAKTGSRSELSDDRAETAQIAALQAKNAELQAQVQQARLILDSATDYAVITMDIGGCVTSWNVGAQQVMGYAESEILGRSGEIIFTSEDRASGTFTTELCRAIEAGRAVNERWHLRRDGTRFWASGMMMPLLDTEGHPQGFLNILRDRTEARAEVERRELLMAEMNHRIKNTFSLVQAVAAQTERHAATVSEFQAAFRARLTVLARSNDVLMRADWHDAPLRESSIVRWRPITANPAGSPSEAQPSCWRRTWRSRSALRSTSLPPMPSSMARCQGQKVWSTSLGRSSPAERRRTTSTSPGANGADLS